MIPRDPAILLSYVNTQLRDRFDSFSDLCDDLDADGGALLEQLAGIGYHYDAEHNRFV